MTALPDSPTGPRRALVVTAHPDDVDFGAAGTIASWTAAGVAVTYCVCTSGDAGAFPGAERTKVGLLRQSEQRAAAAAVGVTDVRFLGYSDGQVEVNTRLRKDITRVIRSVRPHRVLTHSPEINWAQLVVSHPDHRAVGAATLAAIYPDARNEYAYSELLTEGLEPWTVTELWMSEAPAERNNHAVDITEHFDAKITALRAHESQTAQHEGLVDSIREHLQRTARAHGLPEGRLAEAFHAVSTD